MENERLTAGEERLLGWLSWASLAAAGVIACSVAWQLSQAQVRMEQLYRPNTNKLPLDTRAFLAIPQIMFAAIPLIAIAGCVTVQMRIRSRIVATLLHLFVMGIGLACFLIAREAVMNTIFRQVLGSPGGR